MILLSASPKISTKPGDALVLYTDGIVEATCRGETGELEEFGLDRVIEAAREHQSESAAEVIDAIFERLEAYCNGAPAEDDRTLIVVKRSTEAAGQSP